MKKKKEFTAESVLEKNFTRVVAQFKDNKTTYSITFNDAAGTDKKETGTYGEKVTYTATEGFDYWKLGNKIVSYDKKIEIALWGADKKLIAVYDDDTIVDAGIVFGKSGENPRVASFRSKASVKKIPVNGFGQFTSLPGDEDHTKARGYLIYEDPAGVTRVIYAD